MTMMMLVLLSPLLLLLAIILLTIPIRTVTCQQQQSQSQSTPPAPAVLELTPQLYEKLIQTNNIASPYPRCRFFVQLNSKNCYEEAAQTKGGINISDDVSLRGICQQIYVNAWEPLAKAWQWWPNDEIIFTQLNCRKYQQLCFNITSNKFMNALAKVKSTDLLVIEAMTIVDVDDDDHQEKEERRRRIRAVEFYHAGADLQSVTDHYHDYIQRNQPLLPNYNQDAKLLIHQQQPPQTTTTKESQNNNKKQNYTRRLAVLVLATDGLVRPDIYSQFVKNGQQNDIDVHIFIHDKNYTTVADRTTWTNYLGLSPNNNNDDDDDDDDNVNNHFHILPETLYTFRSTISLVRAIIQLLRYATVYYENDTNHHHINNNADDDENQKQEHRPQYNRQFDQYLVVSSDSIPLVDATTIMEKLAVTTTSSSDSGSSSSSYSSSRYEYHGQPEHLTPYIFRQGPNVDNPLLGYGNFVNQYPIDPNITRSSPTHNYGYRHGVLKSKVWITLTHQDAVFFSKESNDDTSNFEMMRTPDEYYFATLANEYYNNDNDNSNNHPNQHQKNQMEQEETSPESTSSSSSLGEYPGAFRQDQPFMYDKWPMTQADRPLLLEYLDDTTIYDKTGHLFARKITTNTNLSQVSWLQKLQFQTPLPPPPPPPPQQQQNQQQQQQQQQEL